MIEYCSFTTKKMRDWMETHPNQSQPTNYKDFPGKMDHTTCIVVQAGVTSLNNELNEIEKFVMKLRNPLYGIKVNVKEGDHDATFKGSELIQWIKDNYKNTQDNTIRFNMTDEKAISLSQQVLTLSHINPLGIDDYKMEEFDLDVLYCFKTFDPIMTESDWISLQGASMVRYYNKGETIVLEDHDQNSIYQVISGRCIVIKKTMGKKYIP